MPTNPQNDNTRCVAPVVGVDVPGPAVAAAVMARAA
jgi:hypothetical protein